jgi:tetratricopeptide (TPR) repeat protein
MARSADVLRFQDTAPGKETAPAADCLAQLCAEIDVVLPRASEPLAALRDELADVLRAGAGGLAGRLRAEMPRWTAALDQVEQLRQCRYLRLPDHLAGLHDDLERALREAEQTAAALEALGEGRFDSSTTPPEERPASAAAEETLHHDSPATEALVPFVGVSVEVADTERAKAIYARADECRRARDYDGAVTLYGEVLHLDPAHRGALVRRGEIHLFRSRPRLAVEDFTAALRGDDHDAGILLLRGDAHLVLGQVELAVEDYTRCLERDAENPRARCNRAVAYRLQGQLHRARKEFTAILAMHPEQAGAWFNRGLVHAALNLHDEAITDFRETLAREPDHAEARTQLQAVRQVHPQPSPPRKGAPEKLPRAEKTPPEVGALPVSCPCCGTQGAIRLQKMDHLHVCRRCSRSFRVDASGGLSEVVRTKEGRWLDRRSHEKGARRAWMLRLAAFRLFPAAVVLVVLGLLTVRLAARARPPAETPLPEELMARVELFTRAWLKNDNRMLRRLVVPGEERNVYRWSVRFPPPALLPEADEPDQPVRVEATILAPHARTTTVRVRIHGVTGAADSAGWEVMQSWEERGGRWFFVVPER